MNKCARTRRGVAVCFPRLDRMVLMAGRVAQLRVLNADLLAALKKILAARDSYHGGDMVRAVNASRAAIAKADTQVTGQGIRPASSE